MNITDQLINKIATAESIRRGKSYFRSGSVSLEEVRDDCITASVRGSQVYEVEIVETTKNKIETYCSCPYDWGGACKHIVAVMLAVMNEYPHRQETKKTKTNEWIQTINALVSYETKTSLPSKNKQQWRLGYGLEINSNYRRMFPLRIKMLKDGSDSTFTLLSQYQLNDAEHFDLADRILISKLNTGFSNYIQNQSLKNSPYNSYNGYSYGYSSFNRDQEMSDIFFLLKEKPLYLVNGSVPIYNSVLIQETPAQFTLTITEQGTALIVTPELRWNGVQIPLTSDIPVLCGKPLWILYQENILRVEGTTGDQFLVFLHAKKSLNIQKKERELFLREGLPLLARQYTVQTELDIFSIKDVAPIPFLYLKEVQGELVVEPKLSYDGVEVWDHSFSLKHYNGTHTVEEYVTTESGVIKLIRRLDVEEKVYVFFRQMLLKGKEELITGKMSQYVPTIHPLEWILTELPKFREAGFQIYGEESLVKHRLHAASPKISAAVSSGIDWFDLSVDVKFGGTNASFDAFVRAIEKRERFVRLNDGSFGVMPEQWIGKFRRALALTDAGKDDWKISRTQISLVDELLEEMDDVSIDEEFHRMRERLRSFKNIEPHTLPKIFNGELRPYQKAGYDWLHFLQQFRFGGILADDMGLGKTVQTLAFLQKQYENGASLPTLIIVPTSIIFNWKKEAEQFTPQLKIYCHHGLERKKDREYISGASIIVTSYGILRRDIEYFKDIQFFYVILDESQNIKNAASVNAKAVRCLHAEHRLALTGTPVENNLMDLWSQMTFLNPGMLGSAQAFSTNYAKPIERLQSEPIAASLKRLVYPFMLRRTKELVADDLPPKQESVTYCEMEKEQRVAYEHWREYYRRALLTSIDEVGIQKSKLKVLEGLMKLRQVCCHPALVDAKYKGSSGKFEVFKEMLEDILSEGHKVLVFSQFVKMLKVLRSELDTKKILYEYLDGSTLKRQDRVERFQTDETFRVFLISLKAGGTGLNLTAADYVIHYDPWWNPAVEMQATDRTHRIGQTKHVFSYKLITKETVEEKVLLLQEKKKHLVSSVISTEAGFVKTLTKEDVEALFS